MKTIYNRCFKGSNNTKMVKKKTRVMMNTTDIRVRKRADDTFRGDSGEDQDKRNDDDCNGDSGVDEDSKG